MYEKGKALNAAALFEIDDVIDPADTRRWIMAGLRSAPPPARPAGKKHADQRVVTPAGQGGPRGQKHELTLQLIMSIVSLRQRCAAPAGRVGKAGGLRGRLRPAGAAQPEGRARAWSFVSVAS
jgi:hypothetical protein